MPDRYKNALMEIKELLTGEISPASVANKQACDLITHFDGIEVKTIRKLEKVKRIVWEALNPDDEAA